MGKKTKPTAPWKHRVMEQRRADAEARQAERNKLTPQQQLAKLDKLGLVAERERTRLQALISKAATRSTR